jgi:hypothetical protein
MSRIDFNDLEKEALIELLMISHDTIEKKNHQLRKTREKLSVAKKRIRRMKDSILFQRKRILEIRGLLPHKETDSLYIRSAFVQKEPLKFFEKV